MSVLWLDLPFELTNRNVLIWSGEGWQDRVGLCQGCGFAYQRLLSIVSWFWRLARRCSGRYIDQSLGSHFKKLKNQRSKCKNVLWGSIVGCFLWQVTVCHLFCLIRHRNKYLDSNNWYKNLHLFMGGVSVHRPKPDTSPSELQMTEHKFMYYYVLCTSSDLYFTPNRRKGNLDTLSTQ